MIKDRSHRLDLIYGNQPLYFVTFATRDRKVFFCWIPLRMLFRDTVIARSASLMSHLGGTESCLIVFIFLFAAAEISDSRPGSVV